MRRSIAIRLWSCLLAAAGLCGCKDKVPPLPPEAFEPTSEPAPVDVPASPTSQAPVLVAPHGGVLLPIGDKLGYVEWVVDTGRLHFLDPQLEPLRGVADLSLHVDSLHGPRPVALAAVESADAVYACRDVSVDRLRDRATTGVLRFDVSGEPCRVLLSSAGDSAATSDAASEGGRPQAGP